MACYRDCGRGTAAQGESQEACCGPAAELGRAVVQAKVDEAYRDPAKWTRMSIMSTAGSGFFSSDRTIQQYAEVRASPPPHAPSVCAHHGQALALSSSWRHCFALTCLSPGWPPPSDTCTDLHRVFEQDIWRVEKCAVPAIL